VQTCIWPSWCHCHSLSLASVKSRLVLPFWYRLTWVIPEKGPLNGKWVCVFRSAENYKRSAVFKGTATDADYDEHVSWSWLHTWRVCNCAFLCIIDIGRVIHNCYSLMHYLFIYFFPKDAISRLCHYLDLTVCIEVVPQKLHFFPYTISLELFKVKWNTFP